MTKPAFWPALSQLADANALAWATRMSLWKPAGSPGVLSDAENRCSVIFRVLADSLEAIYHKRLGLG